MPPKPDADEHVKPYIYETAHSKALHFSISEIQSRMQPQHPNALDLDYTQTMMGLLLFNSRPAHLAMIGLGGGSLAKFCHQHLPGTHIEVLEINPHVIAVRKDFCIPDDDERFAIRLGDGAEFVRTTHEQLDVLMVDGFDSQGQPPALCSQQFYEDCHDALRSDGMLVVNLHAGHRQHKTFLSRIRRAFGEEVLIVADSGSANSIVFACRGSLQQRCKPSLLRRPRHFDAQAWDELMPGLRKVAAAIQKWQGEVA